MIKMKIKKELMGTNGPFDLSIDLEIQSQEFISFYGQSGVGKTTIFRILSGLADPDEGTIQVDGEVWFDSSKKINLPPQMRSIGYVFQDYALFPNMTVRKNIEFAFDPKRKDLELLDKLIQMTQLDQLQNSKPNTLSGGQKQRVALARALARKPKVLLLDEPLSSLDNKIRSKLQKDIKELHCQFKTTTCLVSHDISEVFKLSNKVYLIDEGKIIKWGEPMDILIEDPSLIDFQFLSDILGIKKNEFIHLLHDSKFHGKNNYYNIPCGS